MCESSASTTVRSLGILKDGRRENSWGLFQINLNAHQEITIASSTDPDFSIDWAARESNKGLAPELWVTCYQKYLKGV